MCFDVCLCMCHCDGLGHDSVSVPVDGNKDVFQFY